MTEPRARGTAAPPEAQAHTDAELDARGIVGFGIGLAILIALVLAAVWILSAGLKHARASHDPEPSPLAEANARRLPPEPRLQTSPVEDMQTLRAQEDAVLTEYGPVDRATGTARIPIDRAIEILSRTGLPEPPPPAASSPPAASTPPTASSPPTALSPSTAPAPAADPGAHARRAGQGQVTAR